MILGLTGGIGCGKSTAGRLFEEMGFGRVDCDALVKDEVLRDPEILSRISEHFGPDVLNSDQIDRARLAERVFGNTEELRWLESLVHPEVSRRWHARVKELPLRTWVVEIPLLYEKNLEKEFDFVVCVACSGPVQLARLEQRGMTRTQAEQRIAHQLPLARKIELSHFVLSNDGSTEFLRSQIAVLAQRWSLGPLSKN